MSALNGFDYLRKGQSIRRISVSYGTTSLVLVLKGKPSVDELRCALAPITHFEATGLKASKIVRNDLEKIVAVWTCTL